jgi:hypothetical protein
MPSGYPIERINIVGKREYNWNEILIFLDVVGVRATTGWRAHDGRKKKGGKGL